MTHKLVPEAISPLPHDTCHLPPELQAPRGVRVQARAGDRTGVPENGIPDEGRPFMMASQPDEVSPKFVIKSGPDHDGVTGKAPDPAQPFFTCDPAAFATTCGISGRGKDRDRRGVVRLSVR